MSQFTFFLYPSPCFPARSDGVWSKAGYFSFCFTFSAVTLFIHLCCTPFASTLLLLLLFESPPFLHAIFFFQSTLPVLPPRLSLAIFSGSSWSHVLLISSSSSIVSLLNLSLPQFPSLCLSYFSSNHIYGPPTELVFSEDFSTIEVYKTNTKVARHSIVTWKERTHH